MPFKSKAQMRKFFAMESAGELVAGTAKKWAKHTPDTKALPEHVSQEKEGFAIMPGVNEELALALNRIDPITMGLLGTGVLGLTGAMNGASTGGTLGIGYGNAKGRTGTGMLRGMGRGALTGGGAGLGAGLGVMAASEHGPGAAALAGLAGAGLGGLAGWKGADRLMGEDLMTSEEKQRQQQQPQQPIKRAGVADKLLAYGKNVINAGKASAGYGPLKGGFFGASEGRGLAGKALEALPFGKSQAGRIATPLAGGAAGYGAARNFSAPSGIEIAAERVPIGEQAAAAAASAPTAEGSGALGAFKSHPDLPVSKLGPDVDSMSDVRGGGTPGTAFGAERPGDNHLNGLRALLLGLGLGGVGAHMYHNSKKKEEKTAGDVVSNAVRAVVVKKAAALYKQAVATQFNSFLDSVIASMPIEKTAELRVIQAEVAAKTPLSHAIKKAFPHLSGEERGIMAAKLVSGATKHAAEEAESKRKQPFKVTSRMEATVKPSEASKAMKKMK